MRAAIVNQGRVNIGESPDPVAAPGHAMIRPLRVLVTAADTPGTETPDGQIPGHIFAGIVESVAGGAPPTLAGHLVVGTPDIPSPHSEIAKRGLGAHDPDREVLGFRGTPGCLSERFAIPVSNLVAFPDGTDPDRALFAIPLATASHAASVVRVPGRTYVTVLGDGLEALLTAQVLAKLNASVRLLGTMPDRFDRCARWGVKHRHQDEVGRRADQDLIIDTIRTQDSFTLACELVRPRGTIVLLGGTARPPCTSVGSLDPIVEGELTITGARCVRAADGVQLLGALDTDIEGLITKRYAFDDTARAIEAARDPASIAIVVDLDR